MVETPLVSVICNTYNHIYFIRDAIEGFLMQKTNFPFEILIHDDASTDETANIIREYEKKYPNLIFPMYQSENQYSKGVSGMNARFNYPRARGKYIALCEGDDYWTDPMKLQIQFDFMEENQDYSMCYHSYKILENGKLSSFSFPKKKKDFTAEELVATPPGIGTATKFFRNVYNDKTKNDLIRFAGDYPLNAYLGTYGKCKFISFIKPSVYRKHDGGVWTSRSKNDKLHKTILTKIRIYQHFMENKDEHHSVVSLRALSDIINANLCQLDPNYTAFKMNFSRIFISFKGIYFEIHYGSISRFIKKLLKR